MDYSVESMKYTVEMWRERAGRICWNWIIALHENWFEPYSLDKLGFVTRLERRYSNFDSVSFFVCVFMGLVVLIFLRFRLFICQVGKLVVP